MFTRGVFAAIRDSPVNTNAGQAQGVLSSAPSTRWKPSPTRSFRWILRTIPEPSMKLVRPQCHDRRNRAGNPAFDDAEAQFHASFAGKTSMSDPARHGDDLILVNGEPFVRHVEAYPFQMKRDRDAKMAKIFISYRREDSEWPAHEKRGDQEARAQSQRRRLHRR